MIAYRVLRHTEWGEMAECFAVQEFSSEPARSVIFYFANLFAMRMPLYGTHCTICRLRYG